MIEKLQQKRAILVAQRAQLLAQVNATEGAIAQLDELIGEELVEQSRAASAAQAAAATDGAGDEAGVGDISAAEMGAAATEEVATGGEAAMPADAA
jgi:hypothetical protein